MEAGTYDDMFQVLITGRDSSGELNIPTLRSGAGHNMVVHGDDQHGNWDLEFPTMFDAMKFHRLWRDQIQHFDIRAGDKVESFNHTVVVTMTPETIFE